MKELTNEMIEVLRKYADRQNWGYYDESGCEKGHGEYTEACFIGPELAEQVLAKYEKFKTAENNTIDYDAIHDVLCKVWSRELSADEGLDIIENIVE